MPRDLPSGTVTFLFTDVESSTKLLHRLGDAAYAKALAEHRLLLRAAFAAHGGVEIDTQGDAFFVAFPTAPGAVSAARGALEALEAGPITVRIGVHTGTPVVTEEGYVGEDVHRGARIAAAGHGGQVLLSKQTRDLVDVEVTDLGEHRLKDFADPVPIFQLGSRRFPPLKTISNTNLPRPASSFFGREREVDEVASLVRGGARLVTLTGPGGSGKTRLAIEAASELVGSFRAGVFWIGLATLRDPSLVVPAIGTTLGTDDPAAHIADREMLLVLDNLEQVADAGRAIAHLVEACGNLFVLVTSRELLRVRGEVEYAVPPLADRDAVELFCARSDLAPDETIGGLCRRLDNLPLAVELAAARTRAMSPAEIVERLAERLDLLKGGRDAEERQRTLRATIEWSHDLLSAEEQGAFARLAVFAGGCTLASAEHVGDTDVDTLQSLVEKSLVRRTDDRFWMLETIRAFALERLEASEDADAVQRRHAEHFLSFAEEAEPAVLAEIMRRPGPALDRLEHEHDDLRAALDHFEATGEGHLALRLAAALSSFWQQHGHVDEARRRLERALGADDRPTPARAKALNGASMTAAIAGDLDLARRWAEASLDLHRTLGDAWGIADAMHSLGVVLAESGEMLQARPVFEESFRRLEDLGDVHYALWVRRSFAWTHHDLGDLERARTLHEENLERARTLGNESVEATTLAVLGTTAVDQGRVKDAFPLLASAYGAHRELGERGEAATDLCRFGTALAAAGRYDVAAELLGCWEATCEESGPPVLWVRRFADKTLTSIREHLDEAAVAAAWVRGRALTPDAAVARALEAIPVPDAC